ncbi:MULTISPECIES: PilZ domain-containing protein [Actinoplanes]|uniref:PilZ domain-containing protein n=1 Tax=Actinoplanes TaxID=1865 RepID=UPI0009F99BD5|nr:MULTISPECIES: PilZ domain-containing protein [Actinoplanes]GLY02506.1 hypothetical protein Acsp01_28850 [Actinoplanes sp. NBRC 101535]
MAKGRAGTVGISRAKLKTALAELPDIGADIFLEIGEGVNFRSRLEAAGTESFTVSAPVEGQAAGIEPGGEFDIFWIPEVTPTTRVVLSCRLVEISGEAPYQWTLAPTATPEVRNRRQYSRGGAVTTVRVHTATGNDPVDARLLDISEGGMRCWVTEPLGIKAGDRMRAVLWLGTSEADLGGTVHAVRDSPDGPGQHVVVVFDTRDELAHLIRQYVVAWEIGERRRKQREAKQ